MNSFENHRNENRFEHQSAVLIEDHSAGKYYEGKMQNYSICGMCLHTDFKAKPGTDIFIGIENSPYSSSHDVYHAKVVWCKKFAREITPFYFCMGVNFY